MFKRDDWWICTKCSWKGVYHLTKGVIYRGIDWQHCPSCNSIAIPLLGKDAVLTSKCSGQEKVGDIWTNEDESAEIERQITDDARR